MPEPVQSIDLTNSESIAFVISAPSGVGKTTIRKILTSCIDSLIYSVSYTTRLPRSDEIDQHDYCFVSKDTFQEKINNNFFLEWAQVHQNFYGTPREPILSAIREKRDVLLDVDVQGAHTIQTLLPGAVFIFLLPPSWEILEERLRHRATETEEQVQRRLVTAKKELCLCYEYDYLIVNNNLQETIDKIKAIISTEHSRPAKMKLVLEKIW